MKERSLTRRHFIAGSAGLGVIATCGLVPILAFGEGGEIGVSARPDWDTIHTICQACPNACGFTAYVVNDKLGKVIGDAYNPNSVGNLCARGYGFTQSVYSDAKVKNPMRKKENGDFQTISWDEALEEIGAKIDEIIDTDGSNSIAMIYDGVLPNAQNYSNLLMNGLGSGNVCVDDLTVDVVKSAAFTQIIGTDQYYPDIDNADVILLIDTSFTDVTTPDLIASLQGARQRDARIIALDPRLGDIASMAGDWYAVNPGTELAVLLAVCRQIVDSGRYDKAFVSSSVSDFNLWADAIAQYTPQWAQELSGVQSFRIDQLASFLLDAAPHVAIVYGNGFISGLSYANSEQTAKVVCLLNALLGAWNTTGGSYLPFDYYSVFQANDIDTMPGANNLYLDFGLANQDVIPTQGIGAASIIDNIARGKIKGLITANADIAYDYSSVSKFADVAKKLDLFVCVTEEFTQTAQLANYILPLRSYLTVDTLPVCLQGEFAGMAMANAVVEPADGDNSLSFSQIIDGIATSTKLGEPISDAVSDNALLRLEAFGLDVDGLSREGSAEIESSVVNRMTAFATPSGKIECVDVDAPIDRMLPLWVPPTEQSTVRAIALDDMNFGQDDEVIAVTEAGEPLTFHLITGTQNVAGIHGYNVEELVDITEKYDLDSVWINSYIADLLGISTGDKVFVYNQNYTAEVQAFVTKRIAPSAVYLPITFGRTSSRQKVSYNVGVNPLLFSSAQINDRGALCIQEACVGIKSEKEGA